MKWLFRTGEQRERRQSQRTTVNVPATVRQERNTIHGTMVNISRTGTAVELISIDPLAGDIEIHVPIRGEMVEFLGKIVYTTPTEMEGNRRYGINFTGDRLENQRNVIMILNEHFRSTSGTNQPS